MKYLIHNKDYSNEVNSLMNFAQKRMGFSNRPKVLFTNDPDNAAKPLGKTAFYNPNNAEITIFVSSRHVKDILRSLAHELVHHMQNEQGSLHHDGYMGAGYAQKNPKMREMERQAYEMGNLCFRDWEDSLKQKHPTIYNERRNRKMSLKDWKNKELMENLFQKWGVKSILNEDRNPTADGDVDVDIEKSDSESDALPDTPPPMPAAPEGLPEAKKTPVTDIAGTEEDKAVAKHQAEKAAKRTPKEKAARKAKEDAFFKEAKEELEVEDGPGTGKDNMGITKSGKMVPNPGGDGKKSKKSEDEPEESSDDKPKKGKVPAGLARYQAEKAAKKAKKSGKPEKEPKKMNESLNRKIRVSIKK